MKFFQITSLFVSIFFFSSCAIFTDKPVIKTYTGTVLYPDGTAAVGASVSISSLREYIPVFLIFFPHQPIRSFGRGTTDEKGNYEIKIDVSKPPTVFARIYGEDNSQMQTPYPVPEMAAQGLAEDGQVLTLILWEQYLSSLKKGANQSE